MQIKDLNKRTKNAIIANLERTIRKHGLEETRLVINKWFEEYRAREKLAKDFEEKEAELEKMRAKLR